MNGAEPGSAAAASAACGGTSSGPYAALSGRPETVSKSMRVVSSSLPNERSGGKVHSSGRVVKPTAESRTMSAVTPKAEATPRREAILQTAAELFAEGSYHGVGMRAI